MKITVLKSVFLMSALGFVTPSIAEETTSEKAKAVKNDVKRSVKKGVHRIEEKTCVDSDVNCAAKKAGNRVEETKDAVKDKVSHGIDKVD